jgi:PAS domain S-box-containing protein
MPLKPGEDSREEAQRRAQLWEAAADVFVILKLDGTVVDFNPAFARALRWELADLAGKQLIDHVHFGDQESTRVEVAKLREGAHAVSYENRCRGRDGSFRRFAWTSQVSGGYVYSVGREVPETALLELRAASVGGVKESDILPHRVTYEGELATGNIRYQGNPQKLLGYAPAELGTGGRSWASLVPAEERAAYESERARTHEIKLPFHLDYRLTRKDGTTVRVQDVGQYRFDERGQATAVFGFVTPLVGRGNQTALERATWYYRAIAEAAMAVMSKRSLNEIHQLIADQARMIVGAHQAVTSISAGTSWSQAVNAASMSPKYAHWVSYDVVPDGSGIYTMICETNRAVRMTQAELTAHARYRGFGKEAKGHPPMRGWLAMPLVGSDGKNLGLIQLSDKYDGDFDEKDEQVIAQLARMAAAAIENARLYQSS